MKFEGLLASLLLGKKLGETRYTVFKEEGPFQQGRTWIDGADGDGDGDGPESEL